MVAPVGLCGLLTSGVALNQLHAIQRDTQFFGHKLRLRGKDALPEVALAGISCHGAISTERNP